MTDWVSYVDQLSAITIVGEAEVAPTASVIENREGYVGRIAFVRVDEQIWVNRDVEPIKADFQTKAWGWMLKGDTRRPTSPMYTPRLERGGRYVAALVNYESGLGLLTGGSVFAVSGESIASDDVRCRGHNSVAHGMSGRPTSEIRELLDRTPRDPLAEANWHLPPVQRFQAVARARQ